MWLLAVIIYLPIIMLSIGFWSLIGFAVWRARKAYLQGSRGPMMFWLAIVLAPFIVFYGQRTLADFREADRAREVSAFERHPMPDSMPKVLEVSGTLTDRELLIYLDALNLDEAVLIQNRPRDGKVHALTYTLVPGCEGRGLDYLEEFKRRGRLGYATDEDKACLTLKSGKIDAERYHIPAIVFLTDKSTTLRLPGTGYSGGNYEARVRMDGGTTFLLDYWERPYIRRPSLPLLVSLNGFVLQGNTDWRDYKKPNRIAFLGGAVGLLPKEDDDKA